MANEALTAEEEQARQELLRQKGGARYVTITFSEEEENELWRNAQDHQDNSAVHKLREARWLREAQERRKQQWDRSDAKLLLDQLGHAYTAYTEYLGQAPQVLENSVAYDPDNHKIYDQLPPIWNGPITLRVAHTSKPAENVAGRRKCAAEDFATCIWPCRRPVRRNWTCRRSTIPMASSWPS